MEEIVVGIVGVVVLGIVAQWLAWRFKLPSILLLLAFGFVAGPITGLLPSESLQGDWLYAFVSISIGIILFEGGLSLRLSELREVGTSVLNLVTIGVLITWVLAGIAAYFVAGFPLGLAILLGAIVTVTGPTVVVPLLRHIRPTGRVGAIAKWEGITVDPVGAVLAVLVLETILLVEQSVVGGDGAAFSAVAFHALEGLLLTIATSVGISVIGAGVLIFMLHRRLVPDYLQSALALAIVVGTFGLSNSLQEESGLLETTLLGIMMANQKWVRVRRISEFKEDLQVLLIGTLFILLSAKLDASALDYMLQPSALAFLAILILLVRPVAVLVSTAGSTLTWGEKLFLSWLAPRGIVAAAVASLFAFRLSSIYPEHASAIVPTVFLVIVGTVGIYGLTVPRLARRLGLAHPNPQGVLILGANLWVQRMAMAVRELGFEVMLIDANAENVADARQRQLPAVVADALSETIVDDLALGGIGRFLALTPNDEVNSLACLNFSEIFETSGILQLAHRSETDKLTDSTSTLAQHLRGHVLFGENTGYAYLDNRFASGGEIRTFHLTAALPFGDLLQRYDDDLILLFIARAEQLPIASADKLVTPMPGDRVAVFLPPFARARDFEDQSQFDRLVANALVIDLDEPVPFERLTERAASLFAQRLPVTASTLMSGFMQGAQFGAMPVAEGVALPHYRLPNIEQPELLVVRCKKGLTISMEDVSDDAYYTDLTKPVYAMVFLVSPQEHPGNHLRILASLAGRIDDEDFMPSWRNAVTEQEIRESLLDPERFLFIPVAGDSRGSRFAGRQVKDLDLPVDSTVSLIERSGSMVVPTQQTIIAPGDRLTITGEPPAIMQLKDQLDRSNSKSKQTDATPDPGS
jgi:NhaP-type Na+/H+ or K+/H+ antiporter/mannitol/fructose-specific phosphotransferase system IIA component (Ntr-type)